MTSIIKVNTIQDGGGRRTTNSNGLTTVILVDRILQ